MQKPRAIMTAVVTGSAEEMHPAPEGAQCGRFVFASASMSKYYRCVSGRGHPGQSHRDSSGAFFTVAYECPSRAGESGPEYPCVLAEGHVGVSAIPHEDSTGTTWWDEGDDVPPAAKLGSAHNPGRIKQPEDRLVYAAEQFVSALEREPQTWDRKLAVAYLNALITRVESLTIQLDLFWDAAEGGSEDA